MELKDVLDELEELYMYQTSSELSRADQTIDLLKKKSRIHELELMIPQLEYKEKVRLMNNGK